MGVLLCVNGFFVARARRRSNAQPKEAPGEGVEGGAGKASQTKAGGGDVNLEFGAGVEPSGSTASDLGMITCEEVRLKRTLRWRGGRDR